MGGMLCCYFEVRFLLLPFSFQHSIARWIICIVVRVADVMIGLWV
jgi:hypothetical protein